MSWKPSLSKSANCPAHDQPAFSTVSAGASIPETLSKPARSLRKSVLPRAAPRKASSMWLSCFRIRFPAVLYMLET